MITKYYAEEGDTVEVGAQFLEVDTDAKAPEGGATPAPAAPEPTPAVSVNFLRIFGAEVRNPLSII